MASSKSETIEGEKTKGGKREKSGVSKRKETVGVESGRSEDDGTSKVRRKREKTVSTASLDTGGSTSLSSLLFGLPSENGDDRSSEREPNGSLVPTTSPVAFPTAPPKRAEQPDAIRAKIIASKDGLDAISPSSSSKDSPSDQAVGGALSERRKEESGRTLVVKNLPVEKAKPKAVLKVLGVPKEAVESIRFRNLPVAEKFSNNKGLGRIVGEYAANAGGLLCFLVLKPEPEALAFLPTLLAKSGEDLLENGRPVIIDNVQRNRDEFDRISTVFVGRLSRKQDEAFLLQEFSAVGRVKNCRVIRDPRTHESRCFGYVNFFSKTAVAQAVQHFRKKEYNGHPLQVLKTHRKANRDTKLEKRTGQTDKARAKAEAGSAQKRKVMINGKAVPLSLSRRGHETKSGSSRSDSRSASARPSAQRGRREGKVAPKSLLSKMGKNARKKATRATAAAKGPQKSAGAKRKK